MCGMPIDSEIELPVLCAVWKRTANQNDAVIINEGQYHRDCTERDGKLSAMAI